ncbi:hypothetical protein TWF225_007576 [Orbilia oligospora]|uniref:Uncharacterized protein n=1 Tax=Orbilia oligospora TaxID=2813651 RepID=A0A7C8NVR9_ORBOL|nr:hypothetical protein TWF751_001069 [Orbilia oligospora]KAF3179374.1 hypothetical protein TWF225_007576 [Orbilia oligospora]KAF3253159.1 hypothetical protein TWF128_006590 [Orbilia oligospora]KAF3267257.1 hypothetical protein TWF217_000336 [Orbilia oligospora]KAF3280981.1 hypothetical protein TWF132_011393 [Orbilia oligospora]
MHFLKTAVSLTLAVFAAVATAQTTNTNKPNFITNPAVGAVLNAGDTIDIEWQNLRGDQVTIAIMDGAASDLKQVRTVVTGAPNNGKYTWEVPANIPRSGTYSIRISYDNDPDHYNYSDRFTVLSNVTADPVSSSATTAAPATTSAATTSATSSRPSTASEDDSESSTTIRTSTSTRRTSTSESTGEPTSLGAPPSAGTSTLSSPLAVIMAVLAAAIFIH